MKQEDKILSCQNVEGEVLTTICRRGRSTSPPPPCLTNSAGVKKLPWQMHMILTSSPLPYLYRIPSTRLPVGPSPLVNTHGMSNKPVDEAVPLPLAFSFSFPWLSLLLDEHLVTILGLIWSPQLFDEPTRHQT